RRGTLGKQYMREAKSKSVSLMAAANPLSFSQIPTLSLAQARAPETRASFLHELKHAILNVGFLYIADTGIPDDLIRDMISETRAFFEELPDEEKLHIEMKNQKSFLGYSRLDNEITAGKIDHREQLDLATPHELPSPSSPPWHNLWGPNQWPSEQSLPRFRTVMEDYMRRLSELSIFFTGLIAEALGMPADAFNRFFDPDQLHKMKLRMTRADRPSAPRLT
ncbi:MAG: hypothetical protein Q9162_007593, partial [Coniocarpon cinnabarinum]